MKHIIQSSILVFALLSASTIYAEGLAELQVSIAKGTDSKVGTQIRTTIKDSVKKNSSWTLHQALGGKLGKAKNCFTIDCLKLAGKNTGYPAGLRVRFSGEAQIYDWSIEIYDLFGGKLIGSQKGACELCGSSEVLRTFGRSLETTLKKAKGGSTKKAISKPQKVEKKIVEKVVEKEVGNAKESAVENERKVEKKQTNNSLPDIDQMGRSENKKAISDTEVVIDVFPSNAKILLDGKELAEGTLTIALKPGKYEFQFRLEGYSGLNEAINVSEVSNAKLQFKIHMSKTDPDPVYMSGKSGLVDTIDQRNLWGWIGVGSGSALLMTGIVLSRMDGDATCSSGTFEQCPEIYNTGTAATITTATGSVLLSAGVGLLLWEVLAGKDPERRSAIVPADKGVAFTHTF